VNPAASASSRGSACGVHGCRCAPITSAVNTGSAVGQAIRPAKPRRAKRVAAMPSGRRPVVSTCVLVADGLHARTDGFTSLAVVMGALGVGLGFPLADPIVGLAITVAILSVLRDAGKEVFRRLMDAVDPASVELAERAAAQVPGVLAVGDVRMRWIGHTLRAELAVTLDAALTVEQAHHIAHDVEHRLIHAVPRLAAATVHTEPAAGAEPAHEALAHHR
jgi:cation diffusion facilitator family transporter